MIATPAMKVVLQPAVEKAQWFLNLCFVCAMSNLTSMYAQFKFYKWLSWGFTKVLGPSSCQGKGCPAADDCSASSDDGRGEGGKTYAYQKCEISGWVSAGCKATASDPESGESAGVGQNLGGRLK